MSMPRLIDPLTIQPASIYSSLSWIMGGDYNAKHTAWGSRVIDPRGRQLLRAAQMSDCTFISGGEPTYWPTDSRKIPDILDLFI